MTEKADDAIPKESQAGQEPDERPPSESSGPDPDGRGGANGGTASGREDGTAGSRPLIGTREGSGSLPGDLYIRLTRIDPLVVSSSMEGPPSPI